MLHIQPIDNLKMFQVESEKAGSPNESHRSDETVWDADPRLETISRQKLIEIGRAHV